MAKGPSNLAERLSGALSSSGGEVMDSNAQLQIREEIDMQIATAKAYRRNATDVQRSIETLATLDKETAEECTYSLTRGGKVITGESVRFAEIVMQAWGNCRVASRITAEGAKMVTATGVYFDLETNVAVAKDVAVRITKSDGSRYNDDMIMVATAAAQSKAIRNAILAGVPKGVWNRGYQAAVAVAKGSAATLSQRRKEAIAAFKEKGIPHQEVFEVLGVKSEADITIDTLFTMRGLYQATQQGESSWKDILWQTRREREEEKESGAVAKPKADAKPATDAKPREGFDPAHVERETRGNGVIEGEVIDPKTGEITGPQDQAKDDAKPEATDTSTSSDQASSEASDDGFPGDRAIADINRSAEQKSIDRHTASGGTGPMVEGDPRPAGVGTPAKDEIYWLTGEDQGQDGKWPTFKNGEPMSRVGLTGGKAQGLKVYWDHYEAEEGDGPTAGELEASLSTVSAKSAAPDPASSASATGASPASAEPKASSPSASSAPPAAGSDDFDFSEWQHRLGKTTSWLQVKPLLVELKRSAFWQTELDEADRQATSRKLWEHVAFIKEKFNDPVNPSADASAFTLWIYFETSAKAITAGLAQLKKMPAWQAMSPPNQARVQQMAEERIAQIEAKS